jgi:hypothetical protein
VIAPQIVIETYFKGFSFCLTHGTLHQRTVYHCVQVTTSIACAHISAPPQHLWLMRAFHDTSHSGGDLQPIRNIKSPLLYHDLRGISALLVISQAASMVSWEKFIRSQSQIANKPVPPLSERSLRPTTRLVVMRASVIRFCLSHH